MNNRFVFIGAIISSVLLTGCNNKPKEKTPETVFVTFKDYDDSVLYHTKIAYGTKASYLGEAPKRDTTIDKVYTFVGWDKNIEENLYDNTIFNAQYSEEARKYVVTFYNYDDSELWHTNVEYGRYAVYSSSTPTKYSEDEHIEYEFSGWDKDITTFKIIEDTYFKATFKANEYVFASFNNYDGSLLKKEKVSKGNNAVYTGSTPERTYDGDDKVYRFSGWDKSLNALMVDTTFVAQFKLLNLYTVTFKNYNGSILQEVKVAEGDTAVYTGNTPYRSSTTSGDYITSYTFSGWDSSLENITSNKVITAQFSSHTTVTGQTAIKQHLDNYGSGSYHNVSTGTGSTLGYSGSYYYVGYSNTGDGIYSAIVVNFGYGDSYGYATFQIYEDSTKTYEASMRAYVSNHYYQKLELISISVCRYTTDDQLTLVATLSMLAAQYAIDRASNYLANYGLPYIW